MPKQFYTRESAIEYLLSDQRFRDLYKKDPDDLGRTSALRYANKLFDIEQRGDTLRSIGELRGHLVSEHHKGRGRKPGTEQIPDPKRIPRGWSVYGRGNTAPAERNVVVRVTSGERAAVKALQHDIRDVRDKGQRAWIADWMRAKPRMRDWQVTMNVYGLKTGQQTQVIQHGWTNDRLLYAAGYREDKHHNWKLPHGAPGLRKYLLDLINNMPRKSGDPSKWRGIRLYEIYLWRSPVNEKIDTTAINRQRTFAG